MIFVLLFWLRLFFTISLEWAFKNFFNEGDGNLGLILIED